MSGEEQLSFFGKGRNYPSVGQQRWLGFHEQL